MKKQLSVKDQKLEDQKALDMGNPIYTARHIAKLLDVSPSYVRSKVIKSPGFPAPRKPEIGEKGSTVTMTSLWKASEVIAWFDRQPPLTKAVGE